MSGMSEKALGVLVWKLVAWYLRRRYGRAAKKLGAGALVAAAIAAGIAIALRQRSTSA
jgi:hypothetical protein